MILITTVDIGNGKSDRIELKQGDDPSDAARAFCLQHGIPETVVGPLTDHILDNLRKANDKLDTGDQVGKVGRHRSKRSPDSWHRLARAEPAPFTNPAPCPD